MQMSDEVISGRALGGDVGLDDDSDGDFSDSSREELCDQAMRRWAEPNLAVVAGWLDPSVRGLGPRSFVKQSGTYALPKIHSDLLMTAGKGRLMHVEYETKPEGDLIRRMYNYRGRIMQLFPKVKLTQYIIVLGRGRVTGHDDLLRNGFVLDVKVVYLRDLDPAEFLSDPVLAPLAVLARGSRAVRARSYAAALCLIRDSGHPETKELLQIADALATVRLDSSTIERIRKENDVSADPFVELYRGTEIGNVLRSEGREEGREEGRARLLLALLRTRFGDRPEVEALSARLAAWPDAVAVQAITAATDFGALLTLEQPA